MGIINILRQKAHSYYFPKLLAKELIKTRKKNEADYQLAALKVISDIDKTILFLKEEVDAYSKMVGNLELKYGKHNDATKAITIFPFLDLSMIDILILNKQYANTNDSIEKNFICRTAAQHMYEFLEDGAKALGKELTSLVNILNDTQINLELKELRKSFNKLKDDHHLSLKELRHNVSGHKDRDIIKQLKISNEINFIDFQENFIYFMQFFTNLAYFKKHLFDEIYKKQNAEQNLETIPI